MEPEERVSYDEEVTDFYRVVIGSTTDTEPLLADLKKNSLQVNCVYTSEIIQKYKPERAFYQYILEKEGFDAEEVVFIGDSLVDDVAGPKSVGLRTVLVDRKGTVDVSGEEKPDFTVKSLEELLLWLDV